MTIKNNTDLKFKKEFVSTQIADQDLLKKRISSLDSCFDSLYKVIYKTDELEKINECEENLQTYLILLGDLDEVANSSNNQELVHYIRTVYNKYRNVQSLYISKKFDIINCKMENSIEETNTHINSIKGNMLLSVVALFLGISLTSAMITTASDIIMGDSVIVYYFGIAWVIVFALGIASIIMRKYDKKSACIAALVLLISIVFIFVLQKYA